jgi:hypothetical protein
MRRLGIFAHVLACVGLLVCQLTGLHMHVNEHGYAGIPVGTHIHRTEIPFEDVGGHAPGMLRPATGLATLATHTDPADLDHHPGDRHHDGDRDVSVIGVTAGVSKVFILSVCVALTFVIALSLGSRVSTPAFVPRPYARRERWRPPLRAPPVLSRS